MARGWNALLTAAVVLAGSLQLADAEAAVMNQRAAPDAVRSVQSPVVLAAASGSPHPTTGNPAVPPAVPGQPPGHSRRAEREAKRAARKLQRQMRKQEQQQGTSEQATPPPAAH
jgi:hypothetical protein